jgi:hypothetical protein
MTKQGPTKQDTPIKFPTVLFFNWDFPNPTLERGSVGARVRAPAGWLPHGAPSQLCLQKETTAKLIFFGGNTNCRN